MKKETAKKIYAQVPDWYREVLNDEFGEKTFASNYTDIKTIEDAIFFNQGANSNDWQQRALETNDEYAYRMLKEVVKAINQGWTPDWNNINQAKWYPYFAVLPSGSGFSYSDSGDVYVGTDVGSRLCFESSQKAEYAAKQFEDLYIQYLL